MGGAHILTRMHNQAWALAALKTNLLHSFRYMGLVPTSS